MIKKILPWMISLAVLTLMACAGTPADKGQGVEGTMEPPADSGAIIGEVGTPRERARIHTELASAYFERGNMGVALEELRIAMSADPNYGPAYNVLGLVHMDLKEQDQAQANFERALRINPNDPDANHNYGWFLCRTKREEQGISYFLRAVRNPLYANPQKSYSLAGVCALQKNNERDAVDYFDRALKLDPDNLSSLMNLAQLRYKHGNLDAARSLVAHFNKLVEPSAESLWLALRIERKLGDSASEMSFATQLRRRFPGSRETQALARGNFE